MDIKKYLSNDGLLYVWQKVKEKLNEKVDKQEGKGLSTHDLTDELYDKLLKSGTGDFSGDYNDLENIPTLDGKELKGNLTKKELDIASAYDLLQTDGNLANAMADIEEMQIAGYQTAEDVEKKVSDATKDFLTSKQIAQKILAATEDMATNTSVDTKIGNAIAGVTQFDYEIVDELPQEGKKGTIYLKPKEEKNENDIYDEYLWLENKWEFIGTTAIDLTGYVKDTDLEEITNEEIDQIFNN